MRRHSSGGARLLIVLALVVVAIIAVLAILSPTFLTAGNITDLLMRLSPLAMLAIAETIVLISGGFDLTVGVVMALSAAVVGVLGAAGVPFGLAVLAALAAGVFVGVLNAFCVVQLRLDAFIVTLAVNSIARSVVHAMLKGNVLTDLPEGFLNLRYVSVLGLPLLFLVLVAAAALAIVLLRLTTVGRRIFAVGANQKTALLSGVYVDRTKYLVYCLSGFISAFAGLMYTVRVRAVIPDTGITAPLEVITAVLIGGTAMSGGKGSVLGGLLGILAMFLLLNGFSLLGLNPFWEVIILGLILIYVVGQEGITRQLRLLFGRRKA
jgi:ribose transport system permease protein